ncbi:MAG: hypothetical protein ACE10C_13175, partial [Candidatus Binatia bacterium]
DNHLSLLLGLLLYSLFGHRAGKAEHPLQSLEGLLGSGNPRLGYNLKVPLELCHYPFVFGRPLREEILNLFDHLNLASIPPPPPSLLGYVEGLPRFPPSTHFWQENRLAGRESKHRSPGACHRAYTCYWKLLSAFAENHGHKPMDECVRGIRATSPQ